MKVSVNFGDGKGLEVEGNNYDELVWCLNQARALLGILSHSVNY